MRLTPQTLSANGESPWMIPGPLLHTASIAMALTFSYNANLSAAVEYTYDDPAQDQVPVVFARAGTVLTVTYANHNLIAGDTSDLWSALGIGGIATGPSQQTNLDVAAITDANDFTVTVPNAGILADTGFARIYRIWNFATLTSAGNPPLRVDQLIATPIAAFRLKVTNWVAGTAMLEAQTTKGT